MLIRKNTKAFKTILEIFTACGDRAGRENLIRLYITKAGHTINDRISVEGIQGEAGLFYEMNYQAISNNLRSSNHQLHHSDETPGIYFFHSSANKVWDETPFEFDETIKKEFSSLPELPVVRKKEKAEKFVFPAPKSKTESQPVKKEKPASKKNVKIVDKGPKQPDYKLKQKIVFTDLEKVIFRHPQLAKKDVLDYYNKIAEYILPYLKDRPQLIRIYSESSRTAAYTSLEALSKNRVDQIPDWIQTTIVPKSKEQEHLLLCNDKEHLLFYVEMTCVQFNPWHVRAKVLDSPDYILIGIDSDAEFAKVIGVTLAAKEVLSGLQLPSFVKTDGTSALHIYIPLDAKSKFETCKGAAEYICKLIRLKISDLVAMEGSDERSYGKVSLNYLVNEQGKSVIAPYSLAPGQTTVATPLLWEEVKEGLQLDKFNHETIFKRLKEVGDPFDQLFKQKENADALLERLENNYSFLF
jgi:bifunctional non-homologous end joining protein LigD